MTDRTAEFFHNYSSGFDALYDTSSAWYIRLINRFLRKSMRLRFERTMAGCQPTAGKSVLDAGCGPGHYCIALAQQGAARVVGIDFAENMIALAAMNAKDKGVGDVCRFICGDVNKTSLDTPFDFVVVMGFMDYVADPAAVIAHLLQMTKEVAFFSFPVCHGLLAWQRRLRYRFKCPLFMYDESQLRSLFAPHTGFQVMIERISRDYFVTARRVLP